MQLSLSTPSTAVAEKQSLVRTPDEGAPSGVEHEPAADEAKLLVRWKQQVGAFLVFLVALMYVGSGVMIQLLFEELEFEKPFFFSFASVALCSCHLGFFSLLRCRAGVPAARRAERRRRRRRRAAAAKPDAHAYNLLPTPKQVSVINRPEELVRPALLLAPAYFALNYTYFLSLDLTSVSETMILSASTGVWTLIFSRLVLKEAMTRIRMMVVVVSMAGMCLVTYASHAEAEAEQEKAHHHPTHQQQHAAAAATAAETSAGDLLAVMSAAASGIYVVLLRAVVPDEDEVHMPSLFGMIGLASAVVSAPLFPLLHLWGVETFELPPSRAAWVSVGLNALLSTALPDMLLAQAVVMTSPLLATLGLSLMIPLSVLADYARGLANLTPQFFVGTVAVFVGFLLESWDEQEHAPGHH